MENKNSLLEGSILKALIKLAIPIMGTSFLQMAYNMTDMIWIGRIGKDLVEPIGSQAVAAVGTAGFFMWFGFAFILISKIGAEVGVAQSIGRQDVVSAKDYARSALFLNLFLSILYSVFLLTFRYNLIDFFNIDNSFVVDMAVKYLTIISFGIPFAFINPVFTAILNGYGDSKTPFMINTIGLISNMILDPVLIFGVGFIPKLGVTGAAIATILSQAIVTMIFLYYFKIKGLPFERFRFIRKPNISYVRRILKLGMPAGIQSGIFTIFAILIARIIANWGEIPMAVQKVGSQIEAISWMTAGGFATALSTFIGQNYGAKKWDRIFKGYFTALGLVSIIGIFATVLLIFASKQIFSVFIPEEEAIKIGVDYLRILGVSQLFMVIEITTGGAFNGVGKTMPPSIVGIVFNALRVPAALFLSATALDLNGVWWSISISSVLKGVVLTSLFIVYLIKNPNIEMKKIIKT